MGLLGLGHRAGLASITSAAGHSQNCILILGRAPVWLPAYLEVNGNQCAIATYETGQLHGVMTSTCMAGHDGRRHLYHYGTAASTSGA